MCCPRDYGRLEKEQQARNKTVAEQKANLLKIAQEQAKADILSQKLGADKSKENDRVKNQANKDADKVELEKSFEPAYTQEQYYKKLEETGITSKGQLNNVNIDKAYAAKMNERIIINPAIDDKLDITIRKDDRDEVRGYDTEVLAPYKKE